MKKPEILFLKQEDVIAAGLLDMEMVLNEVEKTFQMLGEGKIKNPTKTMTCIPDDENWTSYFMSMPVYLGGDVHVGGFKWAAESVANQKIPGMPYGIDIITLSDPDTVMPFAIMDGTLITAMRTAASAGVAAKYLASKNTKTACFVGAGVIGRTMILAMELAVPSLEEVILVDLDLQKAEALAKEFEGTSKLKFHPTTDLEAAVKQSDLIVTMTTTRTPFVKTEWVKKNATVIQMSLHEIENGIAINADKIVVDNWAQLFQNPYSLISSLHQGGHLNEEDAIELKEIVTGHQTGRDSEDASYVYASFGLGCLDVMVANKIYQLAKEKGVGQPLQLWDNPLWI